MRRRSSKPPTASCSPAPSLTFWETPDMAQSNGCPQEPLRTGLGTRADSGLCLTHQTEDQAWSGTQRKKKKPKSDTRSSNSKVKVSFHITWLQYASVCAVLYTCFPRSFSAECVYKNQCREQKIDRKSKLGCSISWSSPSTYLSSAGQKWPHRMFSNFSFMNFIIYCTM